MRTSSVVATIVVSSACHLAYADDPPRTDKDVARDIARRGAEYFDDHDWERAREHFHRAYQIVQAPTLALMEARALVRLGRLAEATDAYSRAATATFDDGNEPFRKASVEAKEELARLVPKVPSIQVLVPDVRPRPVVQVDGNPIFGATPISVNPGTHVVTIVRPGLSETWQSVTLVEGERRAIAVAPPTPEAPAPRVGSNSLSPLMWTAFGVGGAGIATGIVTGAIALDRKAKLDEICAAAACPPGSEQDIRDYHHWRTASWVGYLVGLGGLASGAVIVATRRPSGDSTKLRASVSSGGPTFFLEGAF
jgi:hypothetical protein